MSIWAKVARALFAYPEPLATVVPDMTGANLDMQYWINALGENTEWPAIGDLIVELESCGMGATVRNDRRHRVTRLRAPYETALFATNLRTGEEGILHIFYMRRHASIPRVWILVS